MPDASTPAQRRYWLRDEPPDLTAVGGDAFAVRSMVERLVELVAVAPHPFTIALSGSWGAGKTTIARELARQLDGRVPSCLIDLWTEDVALLRRRIVIETAVALRAGGTKEDAAREAAARRLDDATRVSRATPLPATVRMDWDKTWTTLRQHWRRVGLALLPALLAIAAVLLLRQYAPALWEAIAPSLPPLLVALAVFLALRSGLFIQLTTTTETVAPAEPDVVLQREFRAIVTRDGAGAPPVLVVVDNLDRVPADDALLALKEIRALVDIPESRCVFLVPVDRRAFVRQLAGRLGSAEAARDYLDKFFNLDLPLTQPEPLDLREWARGLLELVFAPDGDDADALRSAAQVVASGAAGSPRFVKRIINGMSTRRRLLDESARRRLTLAQIALTEIVIARNPQFVEPLVSMPRKFVELREGVASASDRKAAADIVSAYLEGEGLLPEEDEERRSLTFGLADLLLANSGVALNIDDLRDLLSLRGERFWGGVQDPARLRLALDTGQAGEVHAYLEAQAEDDRRAAVGKASEWIAYLTSSGYARDAVKALVAVAPHLREDASATARARDAARRALAGLPTAEGLAQLSAEAAGVVFAAPADLRSRRLWEAAVSAVGGADAAQQPGLVAAVRAGAMHVTPQDCRRAQAELAKIQSDEMLAPIFADPTEPQLLDAALGNRYAESLAAWDIQREPAGARLPLERLCRCADAGWSEASSLDRVATALSLQVPRVSSLSPEVVQVLEGAVALLHAHRSSATSQLATALASWAGQPRDVTLGLALKLPVDDATTNQTARHVESWLASAGEAEIRALFDRARDEVIARVPAYRTALLRRWASGHGVELGRFAVDDGSADATSALAQSIAGVAESSLVARGVEACELARTHLAAPEHRAQVEAALAARLPGIAVPNLREAPLLIDALAGLDLELTATAAKFAERVRSATREELEALLPAAQRLVEQRPPQRAIVLRGLVDRVAQLGASPLAVLNWLFVQPETAPDRDALVGTLDREIRSGGNAVGAVTAMLAKLRGPVAPNGLVLTALVQRATGATCDEANALLEEAAAWAPVPGAKRDEVNSLLDQIGSRCSGSVDAIKRLRGAHEA